MEATSTRHATSSASADVIPGCPQCGSAMVVRAQWNGGRVHGLNWGCRRAPGCEGTRRIKSPESIRPIAHDASAQAIFDWESAHDPRPTYRHVPAPTSANGGGLRGLFGKVLTRQGSEPAMADSDAADYDATVGYFDGLVEYGFVLLEDRSLPAARVHIDNMLIGPSGVFVVEHKAWAGQMMTTTDSVYVDGRQRIGATDDVTRAAAAFEQTLAHELKPLGASVHPALLFERASNRSFEGAIGKVLIGGTRGLPKIIRGREEPVLGPETIVRLAVAADRLLE